jgi:hypothetical protein
MSRGHFTVMMLTLLVLLGCVSLAALVPIYRLPCGHKESIYARYFPKKNGTPHFCIARGLIHDLQELDRARKTYWKRNNAEVPSLQVLAQQSYYEYPYRDPECYHLECSGSGPSWTCRVASTDQIPGYYLMTTDGRIYFNEAHPPTLEDVKLSR